MKQSRTSDFSLVSSNRSDRLVIDPKMYKRMILR